MLRNNKRWEVTVKLPSTPPGTLHTYLSQTIPLKFDVLGRICEPSFPFLDRVQPMGRTTGQDKMERLLRCGIITNILSQNKCHSSYLVYFSIEIYLGAHIITLFPTHLGSSMVMTIPWLLALMYNHPSLPSLRSVYSFINSHCVILPSATAWSLPSVSCWKKKSLKRCGGTIVDSALTGQNLQLNHFST